MDTTQDRLESLLNLVRSGNISETEFSELSELTKARRIATEKRIAVIKEIKDLAAKEQIGMLDLYTKEEFNDVYKSFQSIVKQPQSTSTRKDNRTGFLVIEVKKPGGRGAPGRFYHGQTIPKIVPKSFKSLDDGNLEANLAQHYTENGKKYFTTPQGIEEMEKLVQCIKASPAR